ncbi:MAG: hypothetical protein V3U51_02140 [Thermoplasmata archaeon]
MEEGDQDGGRHGIDLKRLHISTDIRQGLAFKLLIIVSVVFLFPMVLWILIQAYRPMTDIETAVFFLMVGSFGVSLGAAVVYGGLVKQHLILDGEGITYIHKPAKKHIPWSELESVKLLGVNHPEAIRCGALFSSESIEIEVGSDFDKSDLIDVSNFLKSYQKEFKFRVIEKE